MYMIVGLGNPGDKYKYTRHNVGFLAIDSILTDFDSPPAKVEKKAHVYKVKYQDKQIFFVKPQTFMNLSGESVGELMRYYSIPVENLLVLHDEVDIPYSHLKFHKNRSAGGNNGIKSIIQHLGTQDFARLRIGVGRPSHPGMDMADWVLQVFSKQEMNSMPELLDLCTNAVYTFLTEGFLVAGNKFNNKKVVD